MGWKEWPYWLKGGITAVSLLVLIVLFDYFAVCNFGSASSEYCGWIAMLTAFPVVLLTAFMSYNMSPFSYYILAAVMYFLLGALIGWIYGKIKK